MKEKQVLFEGKYYAVPEGDDYMARNFDGAIFSYAYKPRLSEISKMWILPDNCTADRTPPHFIAMETKPIKSWRDSRICMVRASGNVARCDDTGEWLDGLCLLDAGKYNGARIYNKKIHCSPMQSAVFARDSAQTANDAIRALLNGEFNR